MRLALLTSVVALAVLAAAAPERVAQGIAIPITKRTSSAGTDQSVNFEELNSQLASVTAKILRGFENFEKNTGAPHPAALRGIQKRGTGAQPLINYRSKLWYGNITVGTPGQNFSMNFDTGLSDILLGGPQCGANCGPHIYDPSKSSTYQSLGRTYNYSEDGITCKGDLVSDVVTIAGLTATNQTIGVTTYNDASAADIGYPVDSVLGMAFRSGSAFNATPVFQTLVSEGKVSAPAFSFKLGPTGQSELFLGGVNPALYTGEFTYVPVIAGGGWEVTMDGIESNGTRLLSKMYTSIQTGFDRIAGTSSDVEQLHRALNGTSVGNGWYTFPCNSFPSISLIFGGTSFPISLDSLNIGPASPGSTDCVSAIIGYDIPIWVVGDTFFQNVYTTFDVEKMHVGFAQLADQI